MHAKPGLKFTAAILQISTRYSVICSTKSKPFFYMRGAGSGSLSLSACFPLLQSRDYAKKMLIGWFKEDIHDDYDLPQIFFAKVSTGAASPHDHELREKEREAERVVREGFKSKKGEK